MFEVQFRVAVDKVGNSLSFSFLICKIGIILPSVMRTI